MTDDILSSPIILKKTCCLGISRIQLLWWLKKQVPGFFKNKLIFNLFFTRNKNLVKLIYITQKNKKPTQNLKLTWNPKSYWAHIYFLDTFNIKNDLSQLFLNFPYHIKLFDTKINRFDECNHYSDHFLSILESDNSFSSLSQKKNENEENEVQY